MLRAGTQLIAWRLQGRHNAAPKWVEGVGWCTPHEGSISYSEVRPCTHFSCNAMPLCNARNLVNHHPTL